MLREGNTSRKGQSWVHLTHSYFTPQGHEVNFISGKDVLQRWLDGLIETALAFTRDSHMGTLFSFQFSSVQLFSHVWLFANPWTAAQQASLSIANSWSSNSCPSSQWCHPTISFSVIPFSCLHPSQHQGLFPRVTSSHQVAKVLEFQLQHQSLQWIFRTDFL